LKTIDAVLRVLKKIRDRRPGDKKRNKRTKISSESATENNSKSNNSFVLLFEDPTIQSYVGSYPDMVWIAEALWNLAVAAMSSNGTGNSLFHSRWISSEIFARSHDFALLSEEEDGKALSKSFLDFEQKAPFPPFRIKSIGEDDIEASELSSEFSAQCLVLSIANQIDSTRSDNENHLTGENGTKIRERLRKSLHRVRMAKNEFQLCRKEDDQNDYLGMLSWLALRCMLELRDDDTCLTSLKYGGLIELLMSCDPNNLTNLLESDAVQIDSTDSFNRKLSHLFMCACRAEENDMTASTKTLLQHCSNEMSSAGIKKLLTHQHATLGTIHKKLVQLSESVAETAEMFNEVTSFCEGKRDQPSTKWYDQDEIDWFTVEAFNRGINLSFLGDIANSENLLAAALNLLPSCSQEVQCYRQDMTVAYSGIMERKGLAIGATFTGTMPSSGGMTSSSLSSLFGFE